LPVCVEQKMDNDINREGILTVTIRILEIIIEKKKVNIHSIKFMIKGRKNIEKILTIEIILVDSFFMHKDKITIANTKKDGVMEDEKTIKMVVEGTDEQFEQQVQ
jgi:hypothetical protein